MKERFNFIVRMNDGSIINYDNVAIFSVMDKFLYLEGFKKRNITKKYWLPIADIKAFSVRHHHEKEIKLEENKNGKMG